MNWSPGTPIEQTKSEVCPDAAVYKSYRIKKLDLTSVAGLEQQCYLLYTLCHGVVNTTNKDRQPGCLNQ